MGLNHLNGRVQDAITGRFLSPDPYVPDPGNTQSFNRYSYVNNNPLSFTDPSGFDDEDLGEITVVADAIGDGLDDVFTGIGSLFGFGGGGPKLTANQIDAQHHGINLSAQLPAITVTASSGSFTSTADVGIASQFYSPFTSSAIASVLGTQPSQVATQVTTTPSQSPDELDQINVTATGLHAFD